MLVLKIKVGFFVRLVSFYNLWFIILGFLIDGIWIEWVVMVWFVRCEFIIEDLFLDFLYEYLKSVFFFN